MFMHYKNRVTHIIRDWGDEGTLKAFKEYMLFVFWDIKIKWSFLHIYNFLSIFTFLQHLLNLLGVRRHIENFTRSHSRSILRNHCRCRLFVLKRCLNLGQLFAMSLRKEAETEKESNDRDYTKEPLNCVCTAQNVEESSITLNCNEHDNVGDREAQRVAESTNFSGKKFSSHRPRNRQ